MKDPADVKSYRAIAGSSLILKLFEIVVLKLWGNLLSSDSLQMGYKEGCSTGQAAFLATEVVQYYLRHGSHPLVAVLDCTKAFDLAKFFTMFDRILQRKDMPPIIVRVLMHMYNDQYIWARWGKERSLIFPISNSTRQGSCASPVLWAVYVDPLLKKLRELGAGCRVGDIFMGAIMYADDILLIAPGRAAMELMLKECEKFAAESNIEFSTDPDPHK